MKNKIKLIVLIGLLIIPVISYSSTFFWVGGSGNWSDYGNHWATTSGGNIFHTHIPSTIDDVVFDANSFSASGQTVTADQTIVYCKDMSWVFATNTPTFACIDTSITIKIYGSVELAENMNIPFDGHFYFEALTTNNTIKTYSQILHCLVVFNGFGGEWILLDSLTTTKDLKLNFGTLRTNNQNLSCWGFYATINAPAGLYLGTSTISITSPYSKWYINDPLLVLDADSSIIKLIGNFGGDVYQNYASIPIQKYNIIEFLNSVGGSWYELRLSNATINKVIFNTNGYVRNGTIFIDSLFGNNNTLYIETGHAKINYIRALGDLDIRHAFLGDTINNLIVYGNTFIELDQSPTFLNLRHFFRKAIFYGNLYLDNPTPYKSYSKFLNCTIYGDGNFLNDSNYFDTLKLSIGHTYTFGSNKTQFITHLFDCIGDPGFPIQLVSNSIGQQATLNISQNNFCSDFLYMRDMSGVGSSNLYVGANSNNVFNNNGWIFSECNVDITENNEFYIKIFPNPITQFLTIILPEKENITEYKVYNLLGQLELNLKSETKETNLNVSELTNGIYFLDITRNNNIQRYKFLKE